MTATAGAGARGSVGFPRRSFTKLTEQHGNTRVSFSSDENYLKQGIRQ